MNFRVIVFGILLSFLFLGVFGLLDVGVETEPEANAITISPGEQNPSSILNVLDVTSPKIGSVLRNQAGTISGDVPVLVQVNPSLFREQRNRVAELATKIKYEYSLIPAIAITIKSANLADLANLSSVHAIEFDQDVIPVLAHSTTQIGANRVWVEHGVEGAGVVIAILDTGIDNEHVDVRNVVLEEDFTGEGTDDDHGHGTHVASTAAGTGELSGGINKGVAPRASLMDVKVLNAQGSGKLSDTIAGIQFAVLNNADVISMSLGSTLPCSGIDTTSLAVNAAVKQGKHVVVAAGNIGPLPGTITSPGCAEDAITVGAVDRLDTMAAFSSRGPTLDGRNKPDLVAPGVLIVAAQAGGAYTALSGTSMATPHVSGVVALLLSENKALSPAQVKTLLQQSARDVGQGTNDQGSGRVQAYAAFTQSAGIEPEEEGVSEEPEQNEEPEPEKTASPPKKRVSEQEAVQTSQREERIEIIHAVKEKKEAGKNYFIIDGERKTETGGNETVFVWVERDTGTIARVHSPSIIELVLIRITEFLEAISNVISGFF